jgi:hypothetical protein
MPEVHFTSHLRSLVPGAPLNAAGATVGEVLDALFTEEPQARSYVLDEQGRLRKHVCVFADGTRLPHATTLSHRVRPESKLYVMQALSGG